MKRKNQLRGILNPNRNIDKGCQLQGLALECFKKFDVDLEKIKNEVTVVNFEMVDYEEKNNLSVFGEKESISYMLRFKIYNIEFQAKLLTFEYETKSEILKMDINCETPNVSKEIKYCCNLLQRRRNLNLMFITLITFARYIESRRLICDLLLKKHDNFKIEENKDGGKIIVYRDDKKNLRLGIFWSIECNSDHEIIDKIEIYYKVAELPEKNDLKIKLTHLTEPHLQFNEKYHLWKDLLNRFMKYSIDNNRQAINNDSFEDISIIKHFQLKTDRVKVKKEEPAENDDDDDDDNDVSIVSYSPNETNPLVCIKNPKLLSKNTREASILFNNNDNEQIIYLDSFDEPKVVSNESSSCRQALEELVKPNVIELPDGDSESVILLHSDSEETEITSSETNSDRNVINFVSAKKPKIGDDDLEITGITYVVPD